MATGSNRFTQNAIGKDCCAIGNIVHNEDVPKAMTDALVQADYPENIKEFFDSMIEKFEKTNQD